MCVCVCERERERECVCERERGGERLTLGGQVRMVGCRDNHSVWERGEWGEGGGDGGDECGELCGGGE